MDNVKVKLPLFLTKYHAMKICPVVIIMYHAMETCGDGGIAPHTL